MKILVTDDSKLARKMLIKSINELMTNEPQILEGSNGQEAVELYSQHTPDLCFMDLTMPVMDGFEAVKIICQNDTNAKIIIVSADIQEGSMQRAKENLIKAAETLLENRMITDGKWMITTPRLKRK